MSLPPFITRRCFVLFTGLVSLLSLAFAYTAQYMFSVTPCILCYYERYIYWALVLVALAKLLLPKRSSLFCLSGLIIMAGVGMGVYHLGVEWHWWQGTAACHGVSGQANTVEELRQLINAKPISRCDEVNWRLLGISATLWNLAYFVGFFCLWGIARRFKEC